MVLEAYGAVAFARFKNGLAFRSRTLIGIINTFIMVLVNLAIWRALYGSADTMGGISFQTTITNLVLGIGLSLVMGMDEFAVADKIRKGTIAADLLRPLSFGLTVLAENLGIASYKIIIEFLPTMVVCVPLFSLLGPASFPSLLLALGSLALGYLVLFLMGYALSLVAFWYFNIWSFVTIKNTLVNILAGVFLPVWFMPDWLRAISAWTPFDSIFATPLSLYLGRIEPAAALLPLLRQAAWIAVLALLCQALWGLGRRKLAIQGG